MLSESLLKAVSDAGYTSPTPIQMDAIPLVLAGRDVMARAQTGTGKTAAFALPILQGLLLDKPPQAGPKVIKALVLAPTRELAVQVHGSFVDYASASDLRCGLVYGGVSTKAQIQELEAGVDILVATPGRLLDLMNQKALQLDALQVLVFDEADRMLDMGFSDEIKRILKRVPEQRQTLLFSATFDDAIFALSKTLLKEPALVEVDAKNTAAEKVEQIVYNVDAERKREMISYLIGSKNWQQVLIFTRTKQGADLLAKEMSKDGLKTQAIHGDKSQGARERALEEFKQGDTRVLVATDVAARGLDIDQLKYVVNYELPYIAEDYIHRIGRTGRAGTEGLAISLVSEEENYLLEDVEAVLGHRLGQQWFVGFEPDLNRVIPDNRNNSKGAQKRRAKERAFGKKPNRRRR
jgi:superfamily II DNA/RNA helicase